MEEQIIDLQNIYSVIKKNIKVIIGTTIITTLLGGIYLLIADPTYQSTSLLRIQEEKGIANSLLSSVTSGNSNMVLQRMNTNAEILKSRNVIIPVIQSVEEKDSSGLYPDYEKYVKKHVITKPFKDTEILEVDVTANTPEKAQQANTMIIKNFMRRLAELSQEQQKQTREFLEKRVATSKLELQTAENKLQEYQVANKLYSADDQVKVLTDKIKLYDRAKAESQLNLETAQASLDSINQQLGSEGKAIADSVAIQQYKTELAKLEGEKASYLGKYTDENPKMQEVNNKINKLNSSLNDEIQNIINQQAPSSNSVQQGLLANKFKNEALIAAEQGKQAVLSGFEADNNKVIATLPEKEQGFVRVKRDADVAQEIYIMLAKRLEEAKVAEVMIPNDVQVIDMATLPDKPIAPKNLLILGLSALIGFVLSCLLVVGKSLINRRIITSDDVESVLELPVIGIIPDMNNITITNKRQNRVTKKGLSRIMSQVRSKLWKK